MIQVVKSTFTESRAGTVTPRRAPKPTQYRMLTNHPIEFVMELARHHRVTWLIPSLTFDYSPAGLTAVSPQLTINMDGADIVTAIVWTWTAASFLFYLPYEFNFAQVFDEFINCIKWIKLVHGMKSTPFKPGGPLPSDFRLVFKEARIELEDDFFENLLQMSHELKEDEVVTTMLASPDPYNTTETVEMCWDDFGLDWALGEIRIRSGLRVFMRTASRYDDSRILFLPDLRLRVVLEYVNDEKSKCAKGTAIWNPASPQTATGEAFSGITRRRSYVWVPQHVSATLWGTQVHVYSNGHTPSADGLSSSDEETFLLGLTRVSYVRENNRGRDAPQHRLTVHDLKASWTAQNRDACISIADGVHRAHMLRRILSNDALKILKLHMEEEAQSSSSDVQQRDGSTSKDDRGHRRGYSMSDHNQSLLNQLIGEASTKLVAHCEQ
ncbi:hypothetical protein TELCIR_11607, partial [Teladorsagia circumcincta]